MGVWDFGLHVSVFGTVRFLFDFLFISRPLQASIKGFCILGAPTIIMQNLDEGLRFKIRPSLEEHGAELLDMESRHSRGFPFEAK